MQYVNILSVATSDRRNFLTAGRKKPRWQAKGSSREKKEDKKKKKQPTVIETIDLRTETMISER